MGLDGTDFILIGLVLGAGSALLFAKAYLFPSFPEETTATYLGYNPFQRRALITTRHESIAGCVWLVLGLVAGLLGTVRSVRAHQSGHLMSAWYDILVLLAAAIVVWRLTIVVTDRTSRAEYVPIFSTMMREAFTAHAYPVYHDGKSMAEVTVGTALDDATRAKRLVDAQQGLDRIGKLLDEPREPGEDDRHFAARLEHYFPAANVR